MGRRAHPESEVQNSGGETDRGETAAVPSHVGGEGISIQRPADQDVTVPHIQRETNRGREQVEKQQGGHEIDENVT
eukprot:7222421-Pyramimonas_sp.AAC.1